MPFIMQQACQTLFSAIVPENGNFYGGELVTFAMPLGEPSQSHCPEPAEPSRVSRSNKSHYPTERITIMLGKIAGALIGNHVAGRNDGLKGAVLGAAAARIASRGLGPLGTALAVGYGAKKLIDWNRARKASPGYPASATPAQGANRTSSL